MYKLTFSAEATRQIKKYISPDKILFKKLKSLLQELEEHPRSGTGHPEQLKYFDSDIWSRRIDKKDRLIYSIEDEVVTVYILSVRGHCSDH